VRDADLNYVSTISLRKIFAFFWALLFIAVQILSVSIAYGNNLTFDSKSDAPCSFSLQLQNSPYREAYLARLAAETGGYFTSKYDPNETSEVKDYGFLVIVRTRPNGSDDIDLDAFSKNCLSCHDGSIAIEINANYRNSPNSLISRDASVREHPTGMDYERYVAFGRGHFKPLPMQSSNMILIKGKVGCLTCHNPLNPERKHLVMSDARSALCLTCHDR
jgi:predicted CXXCH cytochrome family protein